MAEVNIPQLRREFSDYYVLWLKTKGSPPPSVLEFVNGNGGPDLPPVLGDNIEKILSVLDERTTVQAGHPEEYSVDLDEYENLAPEPESGESTKNRNPKERAFYSAYRNLDAAFVDHFVLRVSTTLRERTNELFDTIPGTIERDETPAILSRYLKGGMKSTVAILTEGIELIESATPRNSRRLSWFLFRGIKAVFMYYTRTYLEWGIKWDVIPDRAPARLAQRFVFQGYDFSGFLTRLCGDPLIRKGIKDMDPADPVKLYAELLWHGVLMATGFNLFPDTIVTADDMKGDLDSETNKLIDEIYDYYFHLIGKNPVDSANNIGKLMKGRFVDVTRRRGPLL